MIKKVIALVIAVMMIMSIAVISASAEQIEIAPDGADAIADSGADAAADSGADADVAASASGNSFTFDVGSAGWQNFSRIFCHIWVYNGASLADWQTKKERATDNGNGTWTYDLDEKGFSLDGSAMYCIIFSADTGKETYQCFMDTSCFGDTLYCDGTMTENPVDSNKSSDTAYWRNADKSKYGPVLAVTSIGNVVGTACAPDTTPYEMFVGFLKDTLGNAREFSGKSDQQLIDDTAAALGLGQDLIEQAITEAGVTVEWKKAESKAPEKSDDSATQTGTGESKAPAASSGSSGSGSDSSGSGSGSSGSGSDSSGSGSSGSGSSGSGSSGSGSSGASGSASGSTTTGQETTVLFIMLGVMVAAAGVIFFARRKS